MWHPSQTNCITIFSVSGTFLSILLFPVFWSLSQFIAASCFLAPFSVYYYFRFLGTLLNLLQFPVFWLHFSVYYYFFISGTLLILLLFLVFRHPSQFITTSFFLAPFSIYCYFPLCGTLLKLIVLLLFGFWQLSQYITVSCFLETFSNYYYFLFFSGTILNPLLFPVICDPSPFIKIFRFLTPLSVY